MVRGNLNAGGAVIFWTLCERFNLARLRASWDAAGFGDKVPDPRPKVAVLKDALQEILGGPKTLVRPLKSRTGWTVVTEERGDDGNEYKTELVARVCPATETVLFNEENDTTARVMGEYWNQLGKLQATQVTQGMVKVIGSLGGIRLRPTGGVYWLPGDKVDRWDEAARAVEHAAEGQAVSYAISHELTPDAIKAVRDALVHEVQTESKRINDEILSGGLGERAVASRRAELASLQAKVKDYEAILGEAIDVFVKVKDDNDQGAAICDVFAAASVASEFFGGVMNGATN